MDEFKENIALCCKQLRLSSNFAEMAMSQEGGSNQEYLYNLLSNEIKYRTERRKTKLLNTAGFPKIYQRDQFRTDEIDFPSDVSLDSLLDLEFYRKGENVILYGSTGTGKTMLSTLIGISACNADIPVKFYRTAGLINLFAESKAKGSLTSLKKKLNSAQILILDEFGYVPYDRTGAQLLFDYLKAVPNKAETPINFIVEEAHRYIKPQQNYGAIGYDVFERIAKEGRKYGLLLGISSQRPSELSGTVVSQCSNFVVHRVQNPEDLQYISRMVPYVNRSIIERLTYLQTGTALVFGTAINLPTLVQVPIASPTTDSANASMSEKWYVTPEIAQRRMDAGVHLAL